MADLIEVISSTTPNKEEREVRMMAPLVLAYMGDAVFELYIRNYVISKGNYSVNELHKRSTKYVKAKAQAAIVHALEKDLTEEEWTVVKRGRNQKSATVPKNADLGEYRYATGYEALLGYLYYTGRQQRLNEIIEKSIDVINQELKL